MKRVSVFIASPGDLSAERRQFRDVINQLNTGFGKEVGIEFESFGWEDTLASTGRRNQSVINEGIDRCHVFILAMYRRWGQEAPDAEPYTSYTEEEFHRALERWKQDGAPEIFVFFKRVDAASEADPGPQLKKVMEFRKQLEETRQLLYRYFDDEHSFAEEIDRHLRAYAKSELPKADHRYNSVMLPLKALAEVKKAKEVAAQKVREAEKANNSVEKALLKIEAIQLQLAEDAAHLSREGKTEFARQKFSELLAETVDIRILNLAYEFFERTGDIDTALTVLKKWLNLSGPDKKSVDTAEAYCNLGVLYKTRGDLERAEEMCLKSMAINEALDNKEGMAGACSNLAILYHTRGDLERAEEMCLKSLAINEALDHKDGMARASSNLGVLYKARGDYERAEEMYQKSMAIEIELGSKRGLATACCNLGNLYHIRGDYERAEEMYQQSLAIEKVLDHKEGMAIDYGNLGVLYKTRGDLERAEEMHRKSLAISEELGRKEGMSNQYGNLGNLYQTRGDLEQAEEMFQKSLAISEELGRKEGMAIIYGNLGVLHQARGELEQAEEMYQKSLSLNEALNRKEGIAIQYRNLGDLYHTRGDLEGSLEMYQKSLPLFNELGSPDVEEITGLLKDLRKAVSCKADEKR